MGCIVRSLGVLLLAMSVAVFPASWAVRQTAVLAANTTALIMGGTFHPLTGPRDQPDFVEAYLDNAVDNLLDPAFPAHTRIANAVAVFGPEEFFPIGRLTLDKSVAAGRANLQECMAATADCVFNTDVGSAAPQLGDSLSVFGYSQSAIIASLAKRDLIAGYRPGDPAMSFVLVANPMRPNGGILMRFSGWPTIPVLGVSFVGASPTGSAELGGGAPVYPTVDIARQYDALGGDFPLRPLNLLATVNALMGYGLLHGATVDVPFSQARYQGGQGDTAYYMIPTDIVPLLQPLAPFVPAPILRALDAPLRVLIENAYDRDIGPGTPTRARWWPVHDLPGLTRDLLRSVPVAIDNLVEGFGGGRTLGTAAPGPFGVGKPDLAAAREDIPAEAVLAASPNPAAADAAPERPARRKHRGDSVPQTVSPDDGERDAAKSATEPDREAGETPGSAEPASVAHLPVRDTVVSTGREDGGSLRSGGALRGLRAAG